jgi:hypothetical protein
VSGPLIAYSVRCTITNPAVADEWCRWMVEGHLAGVCAAGAIRAELVRLDPVTEATGAKPAPEAVTFEARYLFRSRDDFRRYEADAAPALRAEGLARFPLERGLVYERTTAEVLGSAREVPIRSTP